MRAATWNVNSVRARLPRLLTWLEAWRPDVMALQEIKCADRDVPRQAFTKLGYEVITHSEKGYGGVAFLTRFEPSDVQRGFAGAVAPLDDPRYLSMTVQGIRLSTVYAPNGRKVGTPDHRVKLAWFELLRAVLAGQLTSDEPVLLLGDLNIAPRDRDVWEPSRYRKRNLTSPPERAAFADLLELGLVDVLTEFFGDTPAYTWWNQRSDFFETDRGWRLDHVLASPLVAERLEALTIDREERGGVGSSDHAPIVFDLR